MSEISKKIQEAMQIQDGYHKIAVLDSSRPKHHFVSPANKMIDVWGGIYHNKKYHLFYDTNHTNEPNRLAGIFGHVCSDDLVNWQHLPLALLNEKEKGEKNLNDGTVVIDPSGKPLMYYTRCFYDETISREHVPVRGSADLVQWERIDDKDAVITIENHGGPKFTVGWSDPIIFTDNGRTFIIISKCCTPSGDEMIPIYEAVDDTWLKWEYRGVFADHTGEVLNFIKIKNKWVLIYSPYANPKYFVGDFDIDTYRFNAEKEGILSYGYVNQGLYDDISRGFYATTLFNDSDKPYISGWISGFFEPKGWDGAIAFTRILDLDENNNLLMNPAPQLLSLRKEKLEILDNTVKNCPRSFEIDAEIQLEENEKFELKIENSFCLRLSRSKIIFNDIEIEYCFDKKIKLRMYIDVTIAEIFLENGKLSITRCFPEISDNSALVLSGSEKSNICIYSM